MNRFFGLLGLTAMILVGCASPTGSNDKGDEDSPPAAGTVFTVPTSAALIGTWTLVGEYEGESSEDEEVLSDYTTTVTWVLSNNTFFRRVVEVEVPQNEDPTVYNYDEYKGSWSLDAGTLTVVQTEERESQGVDFTDSTSGWIADYTSTDTYFLVQVDGELYGLGIHQVMKASGSVSGVVGTWGQSYYEKWDDSTDTDAAEEEYRRFEYTFLADGTGSQRFFSSGTETLGAPYETNSLTWSTANGLITLNITPSDPQDDPYTNYYPFLSNSEYFIQDWGSFTKSP